MTIRRPPVRLSECKLCQAPIVFARLDTGKAIPLNPIPDQRGNVAVHMSGGNLYGFVVTRDRLPGPTDRRMVPHYATCEKQRTTPTKPARQPDEPLF
jgi:hypothetical protein